MGTSSAAVPQRLKVDTDGDTDEANVNSYTPRGARATPGQHATTQGGFRPSTPTAAEKGPPLRRVHSNPFNINGDTRAGTLTHLSSTHGD
mmetsp:Transcript_7701/g.17994  ORF Transcript_7701/g.17994 Transcript_7701/m.17994 type:complete len:90 (-) Transcript_7701:1175-1444(-)